MHGGLFVCQISKVLTCSSRFQCLLAFSLFSLFLSPPPFLFFCQSINWKKYCWLASSVWFRETAGTHCYVCVWCVFRRGEHAVFERESRDECVSYCSLLSLGVSYFLLQEHAFPVITYLSSCEWMNTGLH